MDGLEVHDIGWALDGHGIRWAGWWRRVRDLLIVHLSACLLPGYTLGTHNTQQVTHLVAHLVTPSEGPAAGEWTGGQPGLMLGVLTYPLSAPLICFWYYSLTIFFGISAFTNQTRRVFRAKPVKERTSTAPLTSLCCPLPPPCRAAYCWAA